VFQVKAQMIGSWVRDVHRAYQVLFEERNAALVNAARADELEQNLRTANELVTHQRERNEGLERQVASTREQIEALQDECARLTFEKGELVEKLRTFERDTEPPPFQVPGFEPVEALPAELPTAPLAEAPESLPEVSEQSEASELVTSNDDAPSAGVAPAAALVNPEESRLEDVASAGVAPAAALVNPAEEPTS